MSLLMSLRFAIRKTKQSALPLSLARPLHRNRSLYRFSSSSSSSFLGNSSIYNTLPGPTSIRLLQLEPQYDEIGAVSQIACKLSTYDIETAPPYKALSYTWGAAYDDDFHVVTTDLVAMNPLPKEIRPVYNASLICNGTAVEITQNLFDALTHLRDIQQIDLIWIDALCINQQNVEERSAQVSLMSEIYSSASEVVVWLGPPQEGFDELLWASNEFVDAIHKLANSSNKQHGMYLRIENPDVHAMVGVENPLPKLVKATYFYAACRWFHRAWVAQEAFLAHKLRVFCGNQEISWARMRLLSFALNAMGWDLTLITYMRVYAKGSPPCGLESLLSLGELSRSSKANLDVFDKYPFTWFQEVLNTIRSTGCLVPHDKIYASLGIAASHFKKTPITQYIKPDYSMPIEDLLVLVSKEIFARPTSLLNDLAVTPKYSIFTREVLPRLDIPSWVIDYTEPFAAYFTMSSMPYIVSECPPFQANGKERILYEVTTTETTLKSSGACFQTIEEVCPAEIIDIIRPENILSFLEFSCSIFPTTSERRRSEVITRTLVAGSSFGNPQLFEPQFLERIILSLIFSRKWEDQKETVLLKLKSLGFVIKSASRIFDFYEALRYAHGNEVELKRLEQFIGQVNKELAHFNHALSHVGNARSLFKTNEGYIGAGPKWAQPGDQVWMICNASVLFVLRPVEGQNTFTIVGDCYMDGFMHGELFEDPWKIRDRIVKFHLV